MPFPTPWSRASLSSHVLALAMSCDLGNLVVSPTPSLLQKSHKLTEVMYRRDYSLWPELSLQELLDPLYFGPSILSEPQHALWAQHALCLGPACSLSGSSMFSVWAQHALWFLVAWLAE